MTQFERKQMSCFGVWHISPFLTFSRGTRGREIAAAGRMFTMSV